MSETDSGSSHDPTGSPEVDDSDFERDLGVIEAISFVTRACPSGVVVRAAEQALEEIKTGGAKVMKQQAYYVLTAIKGWRGNRATQVHRSLSRYLAENSTES